MGIPTSSLYEWARYAQAEEDAAPIELPKKQVWAWQQKWRSVFCRVLHDATGKWIRGEYDWHVFSFGYCACDTGDHAWRRFDLLEPCVFVVLSAWSQLNFGFQCYGKPPASLDVGADIIVAADTFAWTMLLTRSPLEHGPYFAEREG
jgi:hypothetical protein